MSHSSKDGPGDLQTAAKYKDFVLQLEYNETAFRGTHRNAPSAECKHIRARLP
jgi:hypothetical protein